MKPLTRTETAGSIMEAASIAETAYGDRPRLLRLMECRLLHRAEWEYLGTRHADGVLSWPVDSFRCDRCERTWERAG